MKTLFAAIVLLLAAPGWAQSVLNISDSTVGEQFLMIRYEVDHGASATAVQIDLSLTTASPDGVGANIYPNWDAYVASTGIEVSDDTSGAGTLNMTTTTAARTGVHPVIVMIGSGFAFGDPCTFTGTITFSVNGVTASIQGKHQFFVDGLVHSLCDVFADGTTITAVGTTSYTVTLDAGPTMQTFNVRVLTQATAATQVQLLDTTNATPTVLATYTPVMMVVVGQGTYMVTGSGTMRITLRAEGGVVGNYFLGRFFLPSTVTITNVSRSTGVGPINGQGESGKDDGCAAGATGALPLVPAMFALIWRRGRRHQ